MKQGNQIALRGATPLQENNYMHSAHTNITQESILNSDQSLTQLSKVKQTNPKVFYKNYQNSKSKSQLDDK